MTIERGKAWGEPMTLPADAPAASSDAELARIVQESGMVGDNSVVRVGDDPHPVVGVLGGDLHRTLGSPRHTEADLRRGAGMGFPVDIGILESDDGSLGPPRVFVAHAILTRSTRGSLWRGRTVIAMNAAFRGDQNLAPRGHPNDGRLVVIDGSLGLVDRRRAVARSTSGSHLPHPDLSVRRIREQHFDSELPLSVTLDGETIGRIRSFTLRCVPDAITIVV